MEKIHLQHSRQSKSLGYLPAGTFGWVFNIDQQCALIHWKTNWCRLPKLVFFDRNKSTKLTTNGRRGVLRQEGCDLYLIFSSHSLLLNRSTRKWRRRRSCGPVNAIQNIWSVVGSTLDRPQTTGESTECYKTSRWTPVTDSKIWKRNCIPRTCYCNAQ